MTDYVKDTWLTLREVHAVDMDWPPPPPSPADEEMLDIRRSEVRRQILRRLKQKFPGLPY